MPGLRTHTIADQLMNYMYDKAREIDLIKAGPFQTYRQLEDAARNYDETAGTEDRNDKLKQLILSSAAIEDDDKLAMANLMTAQTILLNSLSNMDRARMMTSAYERFMTLFKNDLLGEHPDAFIQLLKETKDKMLISIVQTMHPTVYHTEFGRVAETQLTQALEKIVTATKRHAVVPDKQSGEFEKAKEAIDTLLKGLKGNGKIAKTVTHAAKVTVSQENKLEKENFAAMQEALGKVTDAYNKALDDAMNPQTNKPGLLTAAETEKLGALMTPERKMALNNCKIDKSKVEFRTWARSADADGRDKATSIELYKAVVSGLENGKYTGPKLDCRDNMKQHEDCISALIQAAFRKSRVSGKTKFMDACVKFAQTHEKGGNINWEDAETSIFQQLTPDNQTEFLKELITGTNEPQFVPPKLQEHTVAFNKMFAPLYDQFLKAHASEIAAKFPGIALEDISLENLKAVWTEDKEYPEGRYLVLALRELVSKQGFVLNDDFSYERAHFGYFRGFFDTLETVTPQKDESTGKDILAKIELRNDERKKLMDVVKRLQVIGDAVDQYGDKVADRYQIANFEKPADFYGALLLFKETGIITVENGKVVEKTADGKKTPPKLSIQPLLETADDMNAAPKMFEELLSDKLVQSYYQARGNNADIMLGFSDGAKSAGNFASEWAINQCARKLKKVFADKNITLRIFQGRGRGPDRGGQFEEGHDQLMMPPEIQKDMILDVTLQSDKPMDMAISPASAQDTFASMITGTITARKMAEELPKQKRAPGSYESLEDAIQGIAKASEEKYCELVSKNKDTLKFINSMHDNSLKSSRKPARGGKAEKFKNIRAITIEYAFNLADAPLHNVGLKHALQQFIDEGKEVMDKDGKMVKGEAALKLLYESHPFFRGMMDKTVRGMQNYDPAIFNSYAKATGVEAWANECIPQLDGLSDLVQNIRSKPEKSAETGIAGVREGYSQHIPQQQFLRQQGIRDRESKALRGFSNTLDTTAHALALSAAVRDGEIKSGLKPLPFKPKKGTIKDKIMKFLVFCMAGEISHRGIPPEMTASVNDQRSFAI